MCSHSLTMLTVNTCRPKAKKRLFIITLVNTLVGFRDSWHADLKRSRSRYRSRRESNAFLNAILKLWQPACICARMPGMPHKNRSSRSPSSGFPHACGPSGLVRLFAQIVYFLAAFLGRCRILIKQDELGPGTSF